MNHVFRLVRHVPASQVWPGSRGDAPNYVHLYAPAGFVSGRIKRPHGGALCGAPGAVYEAETVVGYPACRKCAEIATRHGCRWPARFDERSRVLEVTP